LVKRCHGGFFEVRAAGKFGGHPAKPDTGCGGGPLIGQWVRSSTRMRSLETLVAGRDLIPVTASAAAPSRRLAAITMVRNPALNTVGSA
jgi:hypothetical protein